MCSCGDGRLGRPRGQSSRSLAKVGSSSLCCQPAQLFRNLTLASTDSEVDFFELPPRFQTHNPAHRKSSQCCSTDRSVGRSKFSFGANHYLHLNCPTCWQRHRHSHQQPCWHQLPIHLQREAQLRHQRETYRDRRQGRLLRRMVRSMQSHRSMHGHDECQQVRDRNLQRESDG